MPDRVHLLRILSGEDRSATGRFLRAALWLGVPFYRLIIFMRNTLFAVGIFRQRSVEVPVISVGNLTTGGTGKTPMVVWFARLLREHEIRVAVLSRGYRELADGQNDESLELSQRMPDVPNLMDRNRRQAARIAIDELEMQALILDDGFQHRWLARDLDCVLVDATCPFGFGAMLPRGLMREPISSLRRADAAIITRCDLVMASEVANIERRIRSVNATVLMAHVRFQPMSLVQANGRRTTIDALQEQRLMAFCGIGNPSGFFKSLDKRGMNVVKCQPFEDHHHFNESDLQALVAAASASDAEALVCTMKDLVKINRNRLGSLPLYAVEIEAVVERGEQALREKVLAAVNAGGHCRPSRSDAVGEA